MQQLSGLDAAFLYLETENAPMHVGGVSILSSETSDGPLTLERLKGMLSGRLHVSTTLTRKLVDVPLKLGRPYWIEDDAFDIDYHVQRTQLPEPGGWKELRALVSWEMAQPLDRDRPLWQVLLVEGLESVGGFPPGSLGMISKIHHAAIDGVSGADLMGALYDPSPEPRPLPEPPPREPRKQPSPLELLTNTGRHLLDQPKALGGTLGDTLRGVVRGGTAFARGQFERPKLPFTAPRTPFNHAITPDRSWSCAFLPLDAIRRVRKAADATVNDVVLTVCAGALRSYLESRDGLPEEPLVAMVPISVRTEEQKGTMGNQVSAMLVTLATEIDDPAERLRRVRQTAADAKAYTNALGARTLMDYSQFVPFAAAGLGTRLYTRFSLAERVAPIFNLVITNVPGPQIPLYVAGSRLLAHAGMAPIFDGMGLILPVFSYDGTLAISAVSSPALMPDIDALTDRLPGCLDDLLKAVGA
ncbi:MAG: wax ester/triacylglycerol synthase family O-acyltransferase [Acidobacteriota bacterium]